MSNFLKGILIGIGKIIPGVSGSVIAISLGVYNRVLYDISHIKKLNKKELIFLFEIALGIVFSIIMFSKFILFLLNKFSFFTMFVFLGLIVGGTSDIYARTKEKTNLNLIFIFLIPIIILYIFSFLKFNLKINIYNIFFIGILEAITMIIPGISGTSLLMSLGIYEDILNLIINFNQLSIIFIFGIIVGIITLAKTLNYLIVNYEYEFYYLISSFTFVSVLSILKTTLNLDYTLYMFFIGILLFIVGYFISKKM